MKTLVINLIEINNLKFEEPFFITENCAAETNFLKFFGEAKIDAYEINETYDLVNIVTTKEKINEFHNWLWTKN